jgi:hypothetical protein
MRPSRILLLSSFVLTADLSHGASADKPDVQPGDSWVYEQTTFPAEDKSRVTVRVREVTPDAIMTGSAESGSVFTRDWALRETKRGSEITYKGDPGRPLVQFPLEVGKRWNGNNIATLPTGVQRWQGQATVEKMDKVTVPAGTFDAYLIRYEGYYNAVDGRANVRWVESIWYAPEARRWVKRDWTWSTQRNHFGTFTERRMEELVSVTRAKALAAKPVEAASDK